MNLTPAYYTNYVRFIQMEAVVSVFWIRHRNSISILHIYEVKGLYRQMGQMWNNNNGKDLESLGGGFNITLEVLQDKAKRTKIAEVIRKCGDCMDDVVRIIRQNMKN